jgi:putative oxidoreductase
MTRHLPTVARTILGTIFVVFGINAFLHFIPMPPPAEEVLPFMTGLMSTGYFFPLLKVTEIGSGLLLLSNRFVPLALVLLSPVIVQIAAFHLFLDRSGLSLAILMVIMQAYLGWAYRNQFLGVLAARAEPAPGAQTPSSSRVPVTVG